MAPVTRSSRRLKRVPYQIPTEVLGQIYSHVDRPADFGAVNSMFRGVHKDAHFEKARKRQLVADAIRRNNGRIFYSRERRIRNDIIVDYPPGLSLEDDDLFFNESGCVMIIHADYGHWSTLNIRYGESIKRIEFKAIVGLKSISNTPRFVPVGRFILSNVPADSDGRFEIVLNRTPIEWCTAKFQQNIPALKTDLLKALRTDLENPCTTLVMTHTTNMSSNYDRYDTMFQTYLRELSSLEAENKTVMDVIEAIFDDPAHRSASYPQYVNGNAKIVGDTLEVTLCVALCYKRYRG